MYGRRSGIYLFPLKTSMNTLLQTLYIDGSPTVKKKGRDSGQIQMPTFLICCNIPRVELKTPG